MCDLLSSYAAAQAPAGAPSRAALAEEEFQRLGLVVGEASVARIRQAAAQRCALAMASQEPRQEGASAAEELSRVLLATYRLLDPRRRRRLSERVRLLQAADPPLAPPARTRPQPAAAQHPAPPQPTTAPLGQAGAEPSLPPSAADPPLPLAPVLPAPAPLR